MGNGIRSDAIYEGAGYYRLQCLECGCNFSAKRMDAMYHDATCRKRANRRRAAIKRDADRVVAIIRNLESMYRKRDDLVVEIGDALRLIRATACTS
jgi:hypothetical protein